MRPSGKTWFTWILFAGLSSPAAAAGPVRRADLTPAFAEAVCAGKVGALPFAAWDAHVYDARADGRFLTRRDGLPVDLHQLEHKARALATVRDAGGYAFGTCDQGQRGWALALPASKPLTVNGKGRLVLPTRELAAHCESFRVDFAARDKGTPRTLGVEAGTVAVSGLGDGMVSVTCQPKMPRWQGPSLWYLYPVGQGPARDAPESDKLTASATSLGPWINRVRARSGLAPLAFKDELQAQADLLAADGSLSHDRLLLRKVAGTLDGRHVRLIGENRVRAQAPAAMAWLWWNSPRHRELLLNSEATAAGLALRSLGEEQLAVLVVAADEPLRTARSTGTKGKAAVTR